MTHPKDWKVQKLADVGTGEPFVRQISELFDILGGTRIFDPQRKAVNDSIGAILIDGLIPTFLELRAIRESQGKDLPIVDRLQLHEDFARKLWKAYKDLTQRAATAMGFDIGFLFQKDTKFLEGLKAFQAEHPEAAPNLEQYLRDTRRLWQNDLAQFRNGFLEHQEGSRRDHEKFYELNYLESLFPAVVRTIVDVLVMLMSFRLPPLVRIVEHDDAIHGPGWPNRFRVSVYDEVHGPQFRGGNIT
jgi:hypothetical protein